ncbi:MFS general substrate transporter [Martensiomyces pterosporus]|nr:MFS general substrate transporter [Martensiomyces pterosporus]
MSLLRAPSKQRAYSSISPPTDDVAGAQRHSWSRDKAVVLASIFCINFVTSLNASATATILPQVLTEFSALTKSGLIGIVSYLLIAGMRPVFAKISTAQGHMHALVLSMILHISGLALCAMSGGVKGIVVGSALETLGQAGYGTTVAIVIADTLPLHLRGSVAAYVTVPNVVNYYLGAVVGQAMILQWRWVYGLLGVLALVCVGPSVYSLRRVRMVPGTHPSIDSAKAAPKLPVPLAKKAWDLCVELDALGLVLLCGGFMAVLVPLTLQHNMVGGWLSTQTLAPLVLGGLSLAYFVYHEQHMAANPVVPFRIFKVCTFTCAILASTLFYFTANVALYYFSAFIQVTREVPAQTAMFLQLGSTVYQVGVMLGGWAMQKSRRYRRWAWVGWVLWTLSVVLMLRTRGSRTTTNLEIAFVQAVWGLGSGMVVGSVGVGVQAAVLDSDLAIAITLYGMAMYLGGVLGEGAATTIWVNVLPKQLDGRLDPGVDADKAINSLQYYFSLPQSQRMIVQDAYIETQRVLTKCGIASMLAAGAAMIGLAPYSLGSGT